MSIPASNSHRLFQAPHLGISPDVGNSPRLGILGGLENRYAMELQRAARELNIETEIIGFQELQTRLVPQPGILGFGHWRVDVHHRPNSQSQLPSFAAILVRSMPVGSLEQVIFRMDALQVWQAQGIPMINSPRCLETAIDKWLTLHRLHLASIQVPATIACQNRHQAMEAFELLGRDVLVKPLFGGEGRGIIRLQNRDLAWRTLSTLQQLGSVLYVQQFVPHFGYDVRVLVIGQELMSIRRRAAAGEYRTNISQGGHAEVHELTDLQRDLAIRCARAVEGDVVGVDLLPGQDGQCYALEVNAVPGWKAVADCLKVDVARRIVQYSALKMSDEWNENSHSTSMSCAESQSIESQSIGLT